MATESIRVDGSVVADGSSIGGSGGSIWMSTGTLSGRGKISAKGGDGSDVKGAGGGGRISVDYRNTTYAGNYFVLGGTSLKYPAGSGTVYTFDKFQNKTKLLVDNKITAKLSSAERSKMARMTWIYASAGQQIISFDELDIRGGGKLAAMTQIQNAQLTWKVGTVSGDRSGMLFVLGYQDLDMSATGEKQKLLWGMNVFEHGDLALPKSLDIRRISIEVKGRLKGAENVTIGPQGTFIIK